MGELLSLDPSILLETTLSLMFSRTVWDSLLLETSPPSDLSRSFFSEHWLSSLLCLLANTPEDLRTFLVDTMDPQEPSLEDTPSLPRSRMLMSVTASSTSSSRTDVLLCLV